MRQLPGAELTNLSRNPHVRMDIQTATAKQWTPKVNKIDRGLVPSAT
jgi:hypothetical protein